METKACEKRESLKTRAYAKINLSLRILERLENGYHTLDMICSAIDLFDEICIKRIDNGKKRIEKSKEINGQSAANLDGKGHISSTVSFHTDKPYIDLKGIDPTSNTALKALRLMQNAFSLGEHEVIIEKNIPLGAGLGGSSADAAGIINALCALERIHREDERIKDICLSCGSDVLSMLNTGFKRVSGTGNEVRMLESESCFHLIIATNNSGVLSSASYREYDRLMAKSTLEGSSKLKGMVRSLIYKFDQNDPSIKIFQNNTLERVLIEGGGVDKTAPYITNDLTNASITLNQGILTSLEALKPLSKAVSMTGSGSACIALFDSHDEAKEAAEKLKDGVLITKTI